MNKGCCNEKETLGFSSIVDEAVRHELSKYVRQNNQLHSELMTLKQQLSGLNNVVSKTMMSKMILKNTGSRQNNLIEQFSEQRYNLVFDELQLAKYKYNELMDMVHGDSNKEKEFIKRLMKHKQLQLSK